LQVERKNKPEFFWILIHNLVAITLAFAGVLAPVSAEIARAVSAVNTVWNANQMQKISLD
jgi:cation transport ATPase